MRGSLDKHHPLSALCSVVVGQPKYFSHSISLISIRTCWLAVAACGPINTNWTTLDQIQVLHDD